MQIERLAGRFGQMESPIQQVYHRQVRQKRALLKNDPQEVGILWNLSRGRLGFWPAQAEGCLAFLPCDDHLPLRSCRRHKRPAAETLRAVDEVYKRRIRSTIFK